MLTHEEIHQAMLKICCKAVEPKSVKIDTKRRVAEESMCRRARCKNPQRIAEGLSPLFDNPSEIYGLRPSYPDGVAVRAAWAQCLGTGNDIRYRMFATLNPVKIFFFGEMEPPEEECRDLLLAAIHAAAQERTNVTKAKLLAEVAELAVAFKMLLLKAGANGPEAQDLTGLCLRINATVDAYVAEYTRLAVIEARARELAATLAEEAEARRVAAAEEVFEGALPPLPQDWGVTERFLGDEDLLALAH